MCGIAGIVAPEPRKYERSLDAMVASLRHRGPDGCGTHFFGNCALGHARLSIVDLEGGGQPMLSCDRRRGVTFNGEIYGYREICEGLEYAFQTTSDTEVLLALYQKHGIDMLERLPGLFAFALWDDDLRRLFCARDRFGEKPFYYAFGERGEFVFASEIKAVLASGLVNPVLSREAMAHYLQKLYVHPTQTIYSNVFSLPPAHCLVLEDRAKVMRYWRLPLVRESAKIGDAIDEFRTLFRRAVSRQLIADVQVGAFLSGGLDSSTVVAAASRCTAGLKTFSFGFEGDTSELSFARDAAERYGTEHVELREEKARLDELLLRMADVYDEPFADSSNIPVFLLCKLAREHLKVVLTGDGGDELLAGYSYWYRPLLDMERARKRPRLLREMLSFSFRLMRKLRLPMWKRFEGGIAPLADARQTFGELHRRQQLYFTDAELQELGTTPCRPRLDCEETGTFDDALRMDLSDYMPGDILVKTDRASMAHGLELRAPFLDADFAGFCISLPFALKINDARDKEILRQAFAEEWPESVRRRGKQGFGAPVGRWLELPELNSLKREFLRGKGLKIRDVVDFSKAERFLERNDYKTWILLVLSIWLERTRCIQCKRDAL